MNNGNFYNSVQYTQNRSFFFSGGSDNDSSDDGNDDKKKKKDDKDDKKDDKEDKDNKQDDKDESDTDNPSSEPSPSLNNSARYKSSSSDAYIRSSSPSNVLLPASRLGFGDQAPRYPHIMALPVVRGPVFPGVLTPITISDKVQRSIHMICTFQFAWDSTSLTLTQIQLMYLYTNDNIENYPSSGKNPFWWIWWISWSVLAQR